MTADGAHVYSSSRNKYYDVSYDPESHVVSSNDNLSYFVGYLGYPPIAYLMELGVIKYDSTIATSLSDFPWKDVNQKNKNNFEKTNDIAIEKAEARGVQREAVEAEVERIYQQIVDLDLVKPGKRVRPPKGY